MNAAGLAVWADSYVNETITISFPFLVGGGVSMPAFIKESIKRAAAGPALHMHIVLHNTLENLLCVNILLPYIHLSLHMQGSPLNWYFDWEKGMGMERQGNKGRGNWELILETKGQSGCSEKVRKSISNSFPVSILPKGMPALFIIYAAPIDRPIIDTNVFAVAIMHIYYCPSIITTHLPDTKSPGA